MSSLVNHLITMEWCGELSVGMAAIVEPIPEQKPVLICASTMRVPVNIRGTLDVYLAMRALIVVANKAYLRHVVCPGLGTGVGGMAFDEAAHQMHVAFQMIVL